MNNSKKIINAHSAALGLSFIVMILISFILKNSLSSRELIIAISLGSLNTGIMIFLDLKTISSSNTMLWGFLMKGIKSALLLGLLILVLVKGQVDQILFTSLFFTSFLMSIATEAILFSKIKLNTNKEPQC